MSPCLSATLCTWIVNLYCIGFSFGGLLAIYITASIWRTSYIRRDVLQKNVICIIFGLPVVDIPYIKEVAGKFPEFESTIHSIFSTEDVIPQLSKPLTSTNSPFLTTPVKTGMTSPRPARRSSISHTDGEQVVKSKVVIIRVYDNQNDITYVATCGIFLSNHYMQYVHLYYLSTL